VYAGGKDRKGAFVRATVSAPAWNAVDRTATDPLKRVASD
jgi:hypothetical protein